LRATIRGSIFRASRINRLRSNLEFENRKKAMYKSGCGIGKSHGMGINRIAQSDPLPNKIRWHAINTLEGIL
jgi:hypothetical protein